MSSLTMEPKVDTGQEVCPVAEPEIVVAVTVPAQPVIEDKPVLLEQPEDVEDWLCSLDPDATCGTGGSMGRCPLARYLLARNGPTCRYTEVDGGYYRLYSGDRHAPRDVRRSTPYWAMLFINRVDRGHNGRPVSARTALALLDESLRDAQYVREVDNGDCGQ